jgi:hypothetical protein
MAWEGYFSYEGTEIINASRVEAYARANNLTWFRAAYDAEALPYMLGDGMDYANPLQDEAPWTDPDDLASLDFLGLYPLTVDGLEDSTATAEVIESTGYGGTISRVRHATKSVVFSCALIATSEAGADYGMRWLRRALMGSGCGGGGELCYLSAKPEMELPNPNEPALRAMVDGGWFLTTNGTVEDVSNDLEIDGGTPASPGFFLTLHGGTPRQTGGVLTQDIELWDVPEPDTSLDPGDCLDPYHRRLRKVVFTGAPTRTSKRTTSDQCEVWTVQFTGVAADPAEFGSERPVSRGFLKPGNTNPYVGDVTGVFDTSGHLLIEPECVQKVWEPVYDPLCPALTPPPSPPHVPLGCYSPPANWTRRMISIPESEVPLWGEVVPKIQVHAGAKDIRNLRVRFYADPFGDADPAADPCAFCGDFVISYVPSNSTLVFDGVAQAITVEREGGDIRRADSLVFATDGTPFDWPALTCGFAYTVTFDLPQTQHLPVIDLSLTPRAL